MHEEHLEVSEITLDQFIQKSRNIKCKITGTIKTLLKHKKYIIEVYVNKKMVIRVFKRYNQFEALYELIQMRYKNYHLSQFPSKFQVFGKEEVRKQFFQNMLNQIIKDHCYLNPDEDWLGETRRRMLSIIYLFLTSAIQEQKKRKMSKIEAKKTKERQKPFFDNEGSDEEEEEKQKKFNERRNTILSECRNVSDPAETYLVQESFLKETKPYKKYKMSYDDSFCNVVNTRERRPRTGSLVGQFLSQNHTKIASSHANEFQVKFEHESQWKIRYFYINDSQLHFFKQKLQNCFRTKIELFRIKVEYQCRNPNLVDHFCEKMQFNLNRTFRRNPEILSLYHDYDYQKILIRKPLKTGEDPKCNNEILDQLKCNLIEASKISPIHPNYEGVFDPIGKLFIYLHKVRLNWSKYQEDQTLQIRIRTNALSYDARPIVYDKQILLKQGFLIPISSSFQIIKFECYSIKDEGFVKDNIQRKLVGTYSFSMSELLTKPRGFLLNRVKVRLQSVQQPNEKQQTQIEISLENFSDFSSIYSESFANEHDGKLLKPVNGFEDIDELSITFDRFLRIIGTVARFIQCFWRNVYLFKYPRVGYLFFAIVLFNALFMQLSNILSQLVIVLLLIILCQQKHINVIVSSLFETLLFSYTHPSFKTPKILSTSQISFLKWKNHIKYIVEENTLIDGKLERKSQNKRNVFEFQVHGRKFYFREEQQSFLQKIKQAKKIISMLHRTIDMLINTLEKVGNVLSWYDPKRTIVIILLLLIFSGLASDLFVRLLVSLFCLHRFVKAQQFYSKKHYNNNRRFAVYCIDYIMSKMGICQSSKKKKGISKFQELDEYVSGLVFPIHDELSQKRLKLQMDEIMGVYLDPLALYPYAIKKNYLKLNVLIDIVESCESRLKLKWIPGPEGISNEFQELRENIREIPVIEIWSQKLIINFVMNTPSQLYTAFFANEPKDTNIRRIMSVNNTQIAPASESHMMNLQNSNTRSVPPPLSVSQFTNNKTDFLIGNQPRNTMKSDSNMFQVENLNEMATTVERKKNKSVLSRRINQWLHKLDNKKDLESLISQKKQ